MKTLLRLKALTLIAWCLSTFTVMSQVGINTNGDNPDPSSMLDVSSTSKGVLISRMTQSERDNISSPAFGLLIFNTTTSCVNMWIGTTWRQMCGTCDFPDPVPGNNGPICAGQTLNLTASSIPGATYQWTGPNGFNSTSQNPSITNAVAGMSGSYSVTATVNGCTTLPQSTVATINDIPDTPTATANPNPICGGGTLNLAATTIPGASYLWSGPDNFSSTSQDPEISNVQVYQSGNYNVVATVSGCSSAAGSVSVTVNNPTPATPGSISGSASVCAGSVGNAYSITSVSGATNYVWTAPVGSTIVSGQGTTSIEVTFGTSSGDITVIAENSCGSSLASSKSITVNQIPATTFTFTAPTKDTPVVFTPTVSGGTYSWVFNSGSPGTSTAQNPSVTWSASGTYSVSLQVTLNGCVGSGSSDVSVVGGPFNFTTCGQTGRFGPSQSQCNSAYSSGELSGAVTVTNGIQYWNVPADGTYRIEVWGARSGYDNSGGSSDQGLGARMRGDFALTSGSTLKILVGQAGANNSSSSAGGGGGTFVATNSDVAMIVAGGGGALEGSGLQATQHGTTGINGQNGAICGFYAGGTNCNGATQGDNDNHGGGGAGFCSDGIGAGIGSTHYTPARAFLNGGAGGEQIQNNAWGGFGGGGGAYGNGGGAGGGGGYSGGGAGDNCAGAAGGGGSYNAGTNQSNSSGVNAADGMVVITYVGP